MLKIKTENASIKVWTTVGLELEQKAMKQLRDLAELPIIFKHVAVMPDVHFGYGTTVGTVFASQNAIIPAAVGVDIGCGMTALNTHVHVDAIRDRKDTAVLDETPLAYKDIDLVMEAQKTLVEPIRRLKQIICIKGLGS